MVRVIFDSLPKEPFWEKWIRRLIKRKLRRYESVRVGLNMQILVIARGIPVDVPDWVPMIASKAPKEAKYGYDILKE